MRTVLFVAAISSVFFSCRKTAEDTPDITGKYRITKMVFQVKGHEDQDLFSSLPVCAQDNLLVFGANARFSTEDAGEVCDDSIEELSTWSAKGNKVTIDGMQSTVVSFDGHSLVLSTAMSMMDIDGTVLETLEKQ